METKIRAVQSRWYNTCIAERKRHLCVCGWVPMVCKIVCLFHNIGQCYLWPRSNPQNALNISTLEKVILSSFPRKFRFFWYFEEMKVDFSHSIGRLRGWNVKLIQMDFALRLWSGIHLKSTQILRKFPMEIWKVLSIMDRSSIGWGVHTAYYVSYGIHPFKCTRNVTNANRERMFFFPVYLCGWRGSFWSVRIIF